MTRGEATLARTKPVSPSKLGTHALCALRYLYETERPPLKALPGGPGAVKGVVIHGLVEAYRRKGPLAGMALKQDICARLATSLANGEGGGLARHAIGFYGLHGIFTRGEIVGACQFVASILAKYGKDTSRPGRQPFHGPGICWKSLFGSEVWLEDVCLDLAGRADLIYRAEDGTVHVVDFKSSRTVTDAAVHEQYILQLAAYALLVEQKIAAPRIVVELATPGGVLEMEVDGELRGMAIAAVASVTRQFPRGLAQVPSSLAVTGRHCATCAYRVSCAAYLSCLSDAGGTLRAHSGYDLVGTVTARQVAGGMASLVIRRPTGAACRLDGIPEHVWPSIAAGNKVLAFNVGCREISVHSRTPANFFIFRPDDTPASAYRAYLLVS